MDAPAQRTRTPAGKVMLVEVGCGRTGGIQNHDTMRTEFQGNRLMDWTDERIPDSFKARVWPNPGLGNAMPQPGRGSDEVQEAITIAKELHAAEEHDPPTLKRKLTDLSFLVERGAIDNVRKRLNIVPGVTAPEDTRLQLMPLIQTMHDTTETKVHRKCAQRAKEGVSGWLAVPGATTRNQS